MRILLMSLALLLVVPAAFADATAQTAVHPGETAEADPHVEAPDSHADAAHGEHAEHHGHPELPNAIGILLEHTRLDPHRGPGWVLATFMHTIYSLVIVAAVSALFIAGARRMQQRPGRLQNFVELVIEGFHNFLCGILGKKYGPRFVPFLGTLFIFIWFNNMAGMVPLFMAPTSKIQTTAALALIVFCYVQYIALTELGPLKYLHHLAGEPQGVIMWLMAPLFLVLHVIGELAKPLSLSLRLFGNILGEDILLGSFMLMGVALLGLSWIGLPLQLPFFFLSLLLGTIQALVFTLLATIYILLVLPHEEHEEHGKEAASA